MAKKLLATPRQFSMQRVFDVTLRRPVDKSIIAHLDSCKETSLSNTLTMVYPTGKLYCRFYQ